MVKYDQWHANMYFTTVCIPYWSCRDVYVQDVCGYCVFLATCTHSYIRLTVMYECCNRQLYVCVCVCVCVCDHLKSVHCVCIVCVK